MNNFTEGYLLANSKYFPEDKLPLIQERLSQIPKEKEILLASIKYNDPTLMLVISILVGGLGIDRFLLGETLLGVIKFLTAGCCGFWTIIDWFLIMKATRENNFTKFIDALKYV